MIQTLRTPKLRTPPQPVGRIQPVKSPDRTVRCDVPLDQNPDPAQLAMSLRDVSMKAHRALKMGADATTIACLVGRIEAIECGFRTLGLHDLAHFARNLRHAVETRV